MKKHTINIISLICVILGLLLVTFPIFIIPYMTLKGVKISKREWNNQVEMYEDSYIPSKLKFDITLFKGENLILTDTFTILPRENRDWNIDLPFGYDNPDSKTFTYNNLIYQHATGIRLNFDNGEVFEISLFPISASPPPCAPDYVYQDNTCLKYKTLQNYVISYSTSKKDIKLHQSYTSTSNLPNILFTHESDPYLALHTQFGGSISNTISHTVKYVMITFGVILVVATLIFRHKLIKRIKRQPNITKNDIASNDVIELFLQSPVNNVPSAPNLDFDIFEYES